MARVSAKRIKLDGWACTCDRCGHRWKSIGKAMPARCASCAQRTWNGPPKRMGRPPKKKKKK
jgi:tRNA(Ile2) C34 agmatinyltransferase TiaS